MTEPIQATAEVGENVQLPQPTNVVVMPKPATEKPGSEFPFAISVADVYDGPLDLLLDLIRKQDIDIYDIPIAQITAQYLQYISRLKQLDVELAAEFVYMASLLIHIKSKMLLPKDPSVPEGQMEDPRTELVNRLLEHERFRNAAQMLRQKQQIEEAVWSNPALKEFKDDEGAEPELAADVVDLVKTFRQILDRLRDRPVLQFSEETVTVGQMIDFVRRRLMLEDRPVRLKQLLRNVQSRQALVCMFLALLELIRLQAIMARQDQTFGEIIIKKHLQFDAVLGDAAAVRDDWR
ncbi:MAG TPA: segregation/condensation protein A [Terriglobales bacterium]|nr:segregation/condensation protein A [Terriglobales bacterium]